MVKVNFEHEGNIGLLSIRTHFNKLVEITCQKNADEFFRLGGTAIHEIMTYEGLILKLSSDQSLAPFRAFRSDDLYFEDMGVLSDEQWNEADRHCWITEYYSIDMEGKTPSWFISKTPIRDAHYLFVNLDVIDGGGNIIKRYRISPFTGDHKIMEMVNG